MLCSCLIWNLFTNAECFQPLLRIFDTCLNKVYVRMIKNRLIRLLRCHMTNILRKQESFYIKQWRCSGAMWLHTISLWNDIQTKGTQSEQTHCSCFLKNNGCVWIMAVKSTLIYFLVQNTFNNLLYRQDDM